MEMKERRQRPWWAVIGVGAAALVLSAGGGAGAAGPQAHAARTLRLDDTARLHLVKKSGAILSERGTATGTLPGAVTARFDTRNAAKITGSVTFRPRGGGSLTATVVAYPRSLGTVAGITGYLAVRRGTGRFARAVGSGTFTGSVNRRTWAIGVHARATLRY
jgi:hypothetical protein